VSELACLNKETAERVARGEIEAAYQREAIVAPGRLGQVTEDRSRAQRLTKLCRLYGQRPRSSNDEVSTSVPDRIGGVRAADYAERLRRHFSELAHYTTWGARDGSLW